MVIGLHIYHSTFTDKAQAVRPLSRTGIMAGLKENMKAKLNLSSTLAVTSHTLKSEEGLFTKV